MNYAGFRRIDALPRQPLVQLRLWPLLGGLLITSLSPAVGWSYTPDATHPGLTAMAAVNSRLHRFLRGDQGLKLGLFTELAIDRSKAGRRAYRLLRHKFRRLDPAGGYRPNQDRQGAIGWLMAGSVLADMPASVNRHHFFNPRLKRGLDNRSPLAGTLLSLLSTVEGGDSVRQLLTASGFDLSGDSALAWIRSPHHRYSVQQFFSALRLSVTSSVARQRDHHLANALMALGGLLNVLQDMSVPGHVRDDFLVARTGRLGSSSFDRGSAYERWVARVYGQLGLPARRGRRVTFNRVVDFFSNAKRTGLADLTSRKFFSPGTVPPPLSLPTTTPPNKIHERLNKRLRFPTPRLTGPLDLSCARASARSCYIKDRKGRPLLAYRFDPRVKQIRFYIDHRCMAATARELLPLAVDYSAGLIDFLLRGEVRITGDQQLQIVYDGPRLTKAELHLLWEDTSGRRHPLGETAQYPKVEEGGKAHLRMVDRADLPKKATTLVVAISGRDRHNEQVLAVKTLSLSKEAATPASAPAKPVWEEPSKPASQPAASQPAASQPAASQPAAQPADEPTKTKP